MLSQRSRRQSRKKNCSLSCLLQEARTEEDSAVEEEWMALEDEDSANDQNRFANPWVCYTRVIDDNWSYRGQASWGGEFGAVLPCFPLGPG